MTMPNERTQAVLRAREFLVRLSNVYVPGGIKGIKREVREEARRVFRHFPAGYELTDPRSFDEKAVDEWYQRFKT
jgi:hypothetical protein